LFVPVFTVITEVIVQPEHFYIACCSKPYKRQWLTQTQVSE